LLGFCDILVEVNAAFMEIVEKLTPGVLKMHFVGFFVLK
jgi:hypothetical protein